MPPLVPYQSRSQIPVPRAVEPMGDVLQGVERALAIGDAASRAYDETEATRIAGGAAAQLDGALKVAEAQYGQPDVFASNAAQETKRIYQNAIQSAGNSRIREKVQAKLADNISKAESNIVFGAVKKKIDIAQGNWETRLYEESRNFANLDDLQKQDKLKELRADSKELANTGVISHEKADKDLVAFEKAGWREDAAMSASKDPIGFQDAVDMGRYKGKLSGADLQTAQDIAERTLRAQQARDDRTQRAIAKIDEDKFVEQARKKMLNEDELNNAARLYGWNKDKVDSILRVQLGVRERNPYSDQLIAEAVRLENPIYPTPQMVQDAQRRLDRLVEGGKVSRDSVEYNNAARELRIIASNAARPNNTINAERSRAKTFIRDMLNSVAPDMDAEERRKITGDYNTELNRAESIDQINAVKQKFEKQMTAKPKVVDPSKDASDRLRGLAR